MVSERARDLVPEGSEVIERGPIQLVAPKKSDSTPQFESHPKGGPRDGPAFGESVEVIRHTPEQGREPGPDGSLPTKSERVRMSLGSKTRVKDRSPETEPEEASDDDAPAIPETVEELEEEVETETKELEMTFARLICSGMEMSTEYRGLYHESDEDYLVIYYRPQDKGLILPQEGTEIKLIADTAPPLTCVFGGRDFLLPDGKTRARIMNVIPEETSG